MESKCSNDIWMVWNDNKLTFVMSIEKKGNCKWKVNSFLNMLLLKPVSWCRDTEGTAEHFNKQKSGTVANAENVSWSVSCWVWQLLQNALRPQYFKHSYKVSSHSEKVRLSGINNNYISHTRHCIYNSATETRRKSVQIQSKFSFSKSTRPVVYNESSSLWVI